MYGTAYAMGCCLEHAACYCDKVTPVGWSANRHQHVGDMAKMGSSANGWLSLIRRVQERLESVNARPGLGVYQHPTCDLRLSPAFAFSRPLALQCLPRVRQGLSFHPVGIRPVSLGTNPVSNNGSFYR